MSINKERQDEEKLHFKDKPIQSKISTLSKPCIENMKPQKMSVISTGLENSGFEQ